MQEFIQEVTGAVSQSIIFSIIPFVWWLITARKKENFFKWIGLKKGKCLSSGLKTFIIAVAALGLYILGTVVSLSFMPEGVTTAGSQFAGSGLKGIPVAIAYAYIRTGLSEELLFRGFLLKRISSKFGFVVGNTVQALLFGLLHGIPFGIATGNIGVTVLLTLLPGAFGWFEGWLNERRFEGSVIPSWLIHGTVNLLTTAISL